MVILFPSDYFDKKNPDDMFAEQAKAFETLGFETFLVSLEDLKLGSIKFYPSLPKKETVLYRGWMLSGQEYEQLINAIINAEAKPFTTLKQYLATHHIPNWYPHISKFTPETVCFTDLENIELNLQKLGWQGFFIKDFVKSLKTSAGSHIKSPEQITTVIKEMKKFRGQVEGGICVRRIEAIDEDSEQRYFALNGKGYSSDNKEVPSIVTKCAINLSSNFFSIDVAYRSDGELRVVEVGDGQVSDLVGWSVERFVSLWEGV